MDRPKAIAAAAAITMTLLSGVVAVGANTGALGIGSHPTPAVASPAPVAASQSTASQATANARTASTHVAREPSERESDD